MTTPDPTTEAAAAEALAAMMSEADCASREYPFSDESRARAVLASDWLRADRAEQRAEGARLVREQVEAVLGSEALTYQDQFTRSEVSIRAAKAIRAALAPVPTETGSEWDGDWANTAIQMPDGSWD